MVSVTAELVDQEHKYWLRPGSFCDVTIDLSAARAAPVIPRLATRATDHGYVAYVVEGDVAKERVLKRGMNTKTGWVEVRSGLSAGDLLVVRGAEALADGAKVKTTHVSAASLTPGADAGAEPVEGESGAGPGDAGAHRRGRGAPAASAVAAP
jgi:hypothetical protein